MCNRETTCPITIVPINLPNLEISITYLGTVEARQRPRGRCLWSDHGATSWRRVGFHFCRFFSPRRMLWCWAGRKGSFPLAWGHLVQHKLRRSGRWAQRVRREKGHDVPGPFTAAPNQPVSAGSLHAAPEPWSMTIPRHAGS